MKRINFYTTLGSLLFVCFLVWVISFKNCKVCYSLPAIWLRVLICGLLFFVGAIYFSGEFLKVEKTIHQIESQPLLETDEAVEGLPFCGEGEIESDYVLKSPYTNLDCVYYHSIKEKKSGDSWIIKENRVSFIPLCLKDRRGRLKINIENLDKDFSGFEIKLPNRQAPDPKNSEIDGELVLEKEEWKEIKKTIFGLPIDVEKYRLTEFVLRPKTRVFVYGKVFKEKGELVLREDYRYPLIISKKTRDQYVDEFYRGENLVYLRHFLASLGLLFFLPA